MREFLAVPESLRAAREFVTDHLSDMCCSLDAIEDARLLTSEVGTNAVRHAQTTTFSVEVEVVLGETIHVRVVDHDSRPPVHRPMDAMGEQHRGLPILDEVAERWGVLAEPGGKAVWFELPCQSDRLTV